MNYSRLIIAILLLGMLLFVACAKQAPAKDAAPSVPAKQVEIAEPAPEQPPAEAAEAPAQEEGGEAAAPPSPPAGTPHSVTIEDFTYIPATITIKKGDSVAWTNKDTAPHTATADDGSFNTGRIEEGHEEPATFNDVGTFAYHCSFHPGMHGTVVVTE